MDNEIQSSTINLNNPTTERPISEPSISYGIPNQNLQVNENNFNQLSFNTQPEINNIVENKPEDLAPMNAQPIQKDKFILNRLKLNELLNNATKVAIGDPRIEISTMIQFTFDKNGFKMIASDNENVITQVDNSVKFSQELSIGLNANKIRDLISKLDSNTIEIVPYPEKRILALHSGEDVFMLEEKIDQSTGESINIEDTYSHLDINYIKINIQEFRDRITKANVFAGSDNVFTELGGVYCSDTINTTDKSNMFGIANIDELKNETPFYLTSKFVKLLTGLSFNDITSIGFVKDANNNVKGVVISTPSMTLSGPTDPTQDKYPIDIVRSLTSLKIPNEFKLNRLRLIQLIDRSKIFIDEQRHKSCCHFNVDIPDKKLVITDLDGASKQRIDMEGQFINIPEFNLHAQNLIKALMNFESDMVTLRFNIDTPNNITKFITLEADNIIEIISTKEI